MKALTRIPWVLGIFIISTGQSLCATTVNAFSDNSKNQQQTHFLKNITLGDLLKKLTERTSANKNNENQTFDFLSFIPPIILQSKESLFLPSKAKKAHGGLISSTVVSSKVSDTITESFTISSLSVSSSAQEERKTTRQQFKMVQLEHNPNLSNIDILNDNNGNLAKHLIPASNVIGTTKDNQYSLKGYQTIGKDQMSYHSLIPPTMTDQTEHGQVTKNNNNGKTQVTSDTKHYMGQNSKRLGKGIVISNQEPPKSTLSQHGQEKRSHKADTFIGTNSLGQEHFKVNNSVSLITTTNSTTEVEKWMTTQKIFESSTKPQNTGRKLSDKFESMTFQDMFQQIQNNTPFGNDTHVSISSTPIQFVNFLPSFILNMKPAAWIPKPFHNGIARKLFV